MWCVYIHIYVYVWVCIYIHNGILPDIKKKWNDAIYGNMNGLGDYHTKWSKSDKDKYLMISAICGI